MKKKFERKIMTNKLAVTGLICCILGTTGCVGLNGGKSYLEEECENGICTSNREYTAVCVENADGYSECSDSGNINYTRGAADFRQYGERMPRDHRITQAGAGNNISAAIPPSIDNEVIAYENGSAGVGGYDQSWNPAAVPPGTNGFFGREGNGGNTAASGANAASGGNTAASGASAASGGNMVGGGSNGSNTFAGNGVGGAPVAGQQQNIQDGDTAQSENGDNDISDDNSANKDWLAEEGQSLKELLTLWSDEAGWRLIWKTNRNYTLNAGAMFRGSFADVASALIRAFARARPAPIATFYKGNRVLVVETMEDENAYD